LVIIVGGFAGLYLTGNLGAGGLSGKFSTVLNPFIRASSPIIDSVAEHQLTAWGNIYIELGVGLLFFLVGMYFVLKNPSTKNIFFVVFALTSLFFAASMVRLLAIFDAAFAVIAAVGIMSVLKPFYNLLKESPHALAKSKRKLARVSKEYSGVAVFLIFLILVTQLAFSPQTSGIPRPIGQSFVPTALSSSSLPVGGASLTQPVTAWIESLNWIKTNVPSNDVVVAWWDYGDWLSFIGNVTTICDNTTYNSTQQLQQSRARQLHPRIPGTSHSTVKQRVIRCITRRIRRRRQICLDGTDLRNVRANLHKSRIHEPINDRVEG
jgi:dolichyl-diphosphooligosaccharide--protein glycosyltransferase